MRRLIVSLTILFIPLALFAQQNGDTTPKKGIGTIVLLPQKLILTQVSLAKDIIEFNQEASKEDLSQLFEMTGYQDYNSMFDTLFDEALAPVSNCEEIQNRINNLVCTSYFKVIDTPMVAVKTSVNMSEVSTKNTVIGSINNSVFSKMRDECSPAEQEAFTLRLKNAWKWINLTHSQDSLTMIEELLKKQNVL
jgi:hypothetical protein